MLKILHFSTADNEGGSGRSAYRIHRGLKNLEHDSKMLVGKKVTNDSDVELIAGDFFGRVVDFAADKITRFFGYQYLYVPSSRRVLAHPWVKNAQIIQLFNTHGGYFSHKILPQLSKIAPIVWRLSDMWPMTAHCAYSYGCECYKAGPENCICELSSYPSIGRNTKQMLWDIKKKVFEQCDITIVAPSSWIESLARESILLGKFPIVRIPNGIDLTVFYPRDRAKAREKLGIDPNAKVILFSAHGLDNNERKGSRFLMEALNRYVIAKPASFDRLRMTTLLLLGEGGESFENSVPLPVKKLGFIKDQNQLAEIYSAADIIAVPSIQENLPNNLLEAMACATPAVAFDCGGIKDAVRHMETGYLARYKDSEDFANGMKILLEDEKLRLKLSEDGLRLIKENFDQRLEVRAFEKLYFELVQKRESQ